MSAKRIILTKHARERLHRRAVDFSEVEYAIEHANVTLPGGHPGTSLLYSDMPFGRKLAVVVKDKGNVVIVITAFWRLGQP